MNEPTLDVVVRFNSSKGIHPDVKEMRIGGYRIQAIPSARDLTTLTSEEALLEFADVWEEGQKVSNPEMEAHYILALLSVLGRTKIAFNSTK